MQGVIDKSNSDAASAIFASKCQSGLGSKTLKINPSAPTMVDDQMTVLDDGLTAVGDKMTKLEEATTVLADSHYVPTEVPSDDENETELDRMTQPQKKLRRMEQGLK